MQHPDEEALTLLALEDEPSADGPHGGAGAHVLGCARCAGEVEALREVLRLGRSLDPADAPVPPPPSVWAQVERELGLSTTAPAAPVVPSPRSPRRWLAAAAGALAAVLVGGALLLSPSPEPTGAVVAVPAFEGAEVDPARAVVGERAITLSTALPATEDGEYYEAWLLGDDDRLLALGTVRPDGTTELVLPDGVDLAEYALLDVSREADDGDPSHSGDSLLRGPLPT